jgi:hypothetical protein
VPFGNRSNIGSAWLGWQPWRRRAEMPSEQEEGSAIIASEDAAKGPTGETIATARVPLGLVLVLIAIACALALYFWRG